MDESLIAIFIIFSVKKTCVLVKRTWFNLIKSIFRVI